jgi:3-hydroxyacyl-CoA dehydrogenase
MSDPVTLHRRGALALIVIDNPPVNAVSQAVRAGLLKAIVAADEDDAIDAIVLHGAGRSFIAGADIREMNQAHREPFLPQLLSRVEACRKPVVAALHGAVLGGGFETALASHYRCATADVQLGLPEVKLGLLPGAGGTQRLPRLIGAKAALDMMISGEPIDFARGQALGVIDRALPGGETGSGRLRDADAAIADAALEYARELVAAKSPARSGASGGRGVERGVLCRVPQGVVALIAQARGRRAHHQVCRGCCVNAFRCSDGAVT